MFLGNGWLGRKMLAGWFVGMMVICGCDIIVDPPEPDEYVLVVDVDGHGDVLVSPNDTNFVYGSEVELEAIPKSGWYFDHWRGDVSGDNPDITIRMDDDMEVTAVFKEIPEDEVFLCVVPVGGGDVEIHPIGKIRQDGYIYDRGTTVSLDAYPHSGWDFVGWYLDGGVILSHQEVLDVQLENDDTTITARFERIEPIPPMDLTDAEVWGQDDQFLGVISTDPFFRDSLANPYGCYGDEYSYLSVWNPYSDYGDYYCRYSAYNSYANNPPKIYLHSVFMGYMTRNPDFDPRYDPDDLAEAMGRYDVVRN